MLLLGFAALLVLILMKFDQVWGAVSTVAGTVAPVFYGIAIAYILNVFVHFFEDVAFRPFRDSKSKAWAKVRRPLSVALAYLVVALVIVFIAAFIIPGMVESLSVLADTVQQNAPVYFNNAMAWLNNFAQENDLTFIEEFLAGFNWSTLLSSLTEVLRDFLSSLVGVTFNVASGVFAAVMGFIFSVYMLMGKEKLLRGVKSSLLAFLPKAAARKVGQVATLTNKVFFNFIRGQLLECVILGSLCYVGMSILRLDYALLISSVVALGALIPILGAYIGAAVGGHHPAAGPPPGRRDFPGVPADSPAGGGQLDLPPGGGLLHWTATPVDLVRGGVLGRRAGGFRAFCSAPPPPRCFTGCSAPPCGRGCAHGPSTPRTPACSKRKAPEKLPSQRMRRAIWRIETAKILQIENPLPVIWPVGDFS